MAKGYIVSIHNKIIDEEKQIYQIPIDRSKELMLDEQSN